MNNNSVLQSLLKNQRMIEQVTRISPMAQAFRKSNQLVEQMFKVNRLMNNAFKTIDEFEELLSELNYPPIPNMFGSHMTYLIEEMKKKSDGNEAIALLDDYIVQRFDSTKLDQKVRIWNTFKWIGNRINILEQIVEAHKQGLYYLSVLAVFPQIEGMLADLFPDNRSKEGKFETSHLKESFEYILKKDIDKSDQQWDKFYRDNLLKGFKHSEPIEHLSRHALAHGANFEYGIQVNSVKSFIILDYIITKINNYIVDSSR